MKPEVIIISATGIHTGKDVGIEVQEYELGLGFVAALKLFCQKFPQATQIAIRKGINHD